MPWPERLSPRDVLAPLVILGTALAAPSADAGAFLGARMAVDPPSGAQALCQTYDWACARSAASAPLTPEQVDVAKRVSRAVNQQFREISDQSQYGREEVWALPTSRGGDCEDFALIKKRELIARGLPADRLMLASVLDRKRKSHAVLVIRTESGDLVLDNLTDRVLPWHRTGYMFLRMQNPQDAAGWVAVLEG
ncbi:transglutaminase-like cysteine peptidase [Roseitranquillus sediminis]|uniref:transglutaminase-like cysteine peptidase n=1 Tax=Roseitranquillus sediminis TaxID=2809051 RepID=UPI001D0C373B|nr:transglutaminase-like cysteine peptidase [Roseitranquillus sediminis]MBM9593279.1 transglutaminase-like cysteine peptidase [Roseitranquillus sediminis]